MKTGRLAFQRGIAASLFKRTILFLIPIVLLTGLYIDGIFRKSIQDQIDSELKNATASILNSVRTGAHLSVKNYLRAIAEKNLDIAREVWRKVESGDMSAEDARRQIRRILLSQKIGETGYIYCLDSKGTAVVHPKPEVEDVNWHDFEFVRKQVERKEGYIEYLWKNPDEPAPKPKALYMTYFAPADWIISASSYRDEFHKLIRISDFRESILGLKFGITGYACVFDTKGDIVIHPRLEGRNVFDLENPQEDIGFVRKMIERKEGTITYLWRDHAGSAYREKIAVFAFVPELNWIVASSCDREELFEPLQTVRTVWLASILIMFALTLALACFASAGIVRPIRRMRNILIRGVEGDLSVRTRYRSRDEIGQLSHLFDLFMERLEWSKQELEAEVYERRQAEAALIKREKELAQANRMLQLVLDTIPVGVFWKNRAFEFLGCNRIFGGMPDSSVRTI